MKARDLQQAWVKQAQLDAECGVIECRMCKTKSGLDKTITVWRNGVLVFAVCDDCADTHEIHMRKTQAGIEIRGRPRHPLVDFS